MGFNDLTPEQQEKLAKAQTTEELAQIAEEAGFELTNDMLEGLNISGGYCSNLCDIYDTCKTLEDDCVRYGYFPPK